MQSERNGAMRCYTRMLAMATKAKWNGKMNVEYPLWYEVQEQEKEQEKKES